MDSAAHVPSPAWWSDRWAWRGALVAGPLAALGTILYALLVVRASPVDALVAYAIGGAVGAGIGCLLAGPLGGAVTGFRSSRARAAGPSGDDEILPDDDVYPSADSTQGAAKRRRPAHAA